MLIFFNVFILSFSCHAMDFIVHHSSGFSAGTCRWGEFGEGGLLWGECSARHFEWFEGNPVTEILLKVQSNC